MREQGEMGMGTSKGIPLLLTYNLRRVNTNLGHALKFAPNP
jgi:hypothetical protein